MKDSSNALLAAVRARLLADPAIAAKCQDRVYDRPLGDNSLFPYVQLGETQVLPWEAQCIDGVQIYLTLHVWAREGWAGDDVRDICAAIYDSLHAQKFPVTGHDLQLIEHQTTRVLRDPDGETRHGVIEFSAYTTPA